MFFRLLDDVLPEPDRPTIKRFPEENAFDDVEDLRPESEYLTVHPGTAYGPAKRWPPDRFGECLLRLVQKTQMNIVALGVEDEREIATEVLEPIEPDDYLNLVGKTTLSEAMQVLNGSQGTIANDSGIMHLSAALGTPTFGLFGSSDPSLTHPVGPATDSIYEDVECSPCFERECPLDQDRYKCLEGIEPARVTYEFLKLLEIDSIPSSSLRSEV
jgi:heptosyltransferase-2